MFLRSPSTLLHWSLEIITNLPRDLCSRTSKNTGGPFLANDVTLVTSYGYCQSLKINDIRTCDVCLTICEAGGIFCETMGGGVHRDTESLTLSAAQTHTANVIGVRPPGFEFFLHSQVWIYFECLFCVREVWQDFIRVVVLCLLS